MHAHVVRPLDLPGPSRDVLRGCVVTARIVTHPDRAAVDQDVVRTLHHAPHEQNRPVPDLARSLALGVGARPMAARATHFLEYGHRSVCPVVALSEELHERLRSVLD